MKLTKAMRAAIVTRLIERTRAPRDAVFRNREHALALRLLMGRYGEDVFERCRSMPDGWFRSCRSVTMESRFSERLTPCMVSWTHRRNQLPRRQLRRFHSLSLSEYAPLPATASDTWQAIHLNPYFDDIESYARDLREHEDEVEALRTLTDGILSSYGTVELLSKDWPDGYSLLPAEMLAPSPVALGVPAVRICDLALRIEKIRQAA